MPSPEPNSVARLLEAYNKIDTYLRQLPGVDRNAEHSYLLQQAARSNAVVARHETELHTIAKLRNVIIHNPFPNQSTPIALPFEDTVKRYSEICGAILRPPTAMSIAVPASKIFTANLGTALGKVLVTMNQSTYTHAPIIENDKMIGIFSENTLLSYLAEKGEAIILSDMAMADFKAFLPLSSHRSEAFEFLPRGAKLADVYEVFNKAIKVHQRVGMVFITEHGKPDEKPLGIITAWDLASPEFETL
jgi:predicted transcriptional regulator